MFVVVFLNIFNTLLIKKMLFYIKWPVIRKISNTDIKKTHHIDINHKRVFVIPLLCLGVITLDKAFSFRQINLVSLSVDSFVCLWPTGE